MVMALGRCVDGGTLAIIFYLGNGFFAEVSAVGEDVDGLPDCGADRLHDGFELLFVVGGFANKATYPIFNMPNLDPFILNGLLTLKIPSGTPFPSFS